MRELLMFSLLLAGASSAGAQTSPSPAKKNVFRTATEFNITRTFSDYTRKIAIYGEVDQRKTEEDFATEIVHEKIQDVKERFSPTGRIVCGGSVEGSAQITGDTNVLTTAAHNFQNLDACTDLSAPKDCLFKIDTKAGHQELVVESVRTGLTCPRSKLPEHDWAVVKLSGRVKAVKPYRVEQRAIDHMREGDTVVNVCHSKDFLRLTSNGSVYAPKHIQKCRLGHVYYSQDALPKPYIMSAMCDAGSFCSGGSLLNTNEDDPALLAIVEGNNESKEALDRAYRRARAATESGKGFGSPNTGKYNEDSWATYYIPIAGAFLETLKATSEADVMRPKSIKPLEP